MIKSKDKNQKCPLIFNAKLVDDNRYPKICHYNERGPVFAGKLQFNFELSVGNLCNITAFGTYTQRSSAFDYESFTTEYTEISGAPRVGCSFQIIDYEVFEIK